MNKSWCSPPTKSVSYVERQDWVAVAGTMLLKSGSDCDDDDVVVDGRDKKTIPGTSCGDFGLSGIHLPAVKIQGIKSNI